MLYKKIFFSVVVFSVVSLDGMNMKKMRKGAAQREQRIQNAFLTPSGIGTVPQDVSRSCIEQDYSLQDVARLKQTSTICNKAYDVENICPFVCEATCSTHACGRLAANYYACTKALVHFASKENKETQERDRNTFKHLWVYHEKVRNDNVARLLGKTALSISDQMSAYKNKKKHYMITRRVVKDRILEHLACTLCDRDVSAAKMILSGGVLDIQDLVKNYQTKSFLAEDFFVVSDLICRACLLGDAELVYLLLSKNIGKYGLNCIMRNSSPQLVTELIDRDMLPAKIVDKHDKTLLHYAAQYNHSSVIKTLLKKEVYVNCRTDEGNTPLHYAVAYDQVSCVMVLLAWSDCDPRVKNNKGLTALDLTYNRMLLGDLVKNTHRKIIRKLIKAYSEKDDTDFLRGGDYYQSLD